MQFYKIFAGSLLTTGIALSGCTTEQIEIPQSELYAREFIKQFGVVDPNHDWNNATQGSVTVVTSSPSHVEVLADIKGKRYIFADYQNVKGSETIKFTIPKGVSDLIVNVDGRQFKTTVGGTVTTTKSSRAIWEKHDSKVEITRTDYRPLTDEGVTAFQNYLPENQDNLVKVTQNFSFVSNGEFTIYPVYWQTNSYNTLGIYYIDGDEMVLVPFYTNKITPVDGTKGNLLYIKEDPLTPNMADAKDNIPLKDENKPMIIPNDKLSDELNPLKYNNSGHDSFLDFTPEDWKTFKRRWLIERREKDVWYFVSNYDDYFDLSYIKEIPNYWDHTNQLFLADILCEPADATHVKITNIAIGPFNNWIYPGTSTNSHPGGEVKGWKSRGIHVKIAEGTKFGMYIRVWHGYPAEDKPTIDNVDIVRLELDPTTKLPIPDKYTRYYSEAKYNPTVGGSNVFGATYMYNAPTGNYRVLGFEDWGRDVHDLNDMMFFITSIEPEKIPHVEDEDNPEPEKYEYLIAAEDLGGTCDWDFNDVVASVTTVSKNYTDDTAEDGPATYPYTEVTVTPLAAGGTLPVYLMYTGKVCTSKDDYESANVQNYMLVDEFHSWLTGREEAPTVPTNVGASASTKGKPVTFNVPGGDYTLGMHKKYESTDEGKNNMGGFWIIAINSKDTPFTLQTGTGDLILQTSIPENKGITKIEAPAADHNVNSIAPQMICVGNDWLWPREGKKIHDAYVGFNDWLNAPENGDWYGEGKYNESLVTKRN